MAKLVYGTFSIEDDMKEEKVYVEREGKVCDDCGAQFPTFEVLRYHKETVHGFKELKDTSDDKQSMQCPICKKVLRSPYYYQEHLQKHNEGPTCECERCGAPFKFSSSLRRHVKVCIGKFAYHQIIAGWSQFDYSDVKLVYIWVFYAMDLYFKVSCVL